VGRHAVPGLYYAMSYANTSAVLLTWFREVCGQSGLPYPDFLRDAAAVPPGSEGLTVLPHFMGKPPPDGDPAARGAVLGLSLGHTRAHLARAILESCACLLRECLEPLAQKGLRAERVRSLGGAARSDLWLQIKADLLGMPVERPLCQAAASLGAAMLAACGTGQFSSLAEASSAWYRPAAVFEPRPAAREAYADLYRRYQHYSRLIYSPPSHLESKASHLGSKASTPESKGN
jgi:xylulokinase